MSSNATLLFFGLIVWLVIQTVAIKTRKIGVSISQHFPFAVHTIGRETSLKNLEGLDILILNEFAKKHGLEIQYSISNKSLHQVFSSNKLTEEFFNSSINSQIDIFAGGFEPNVINTKYLSPSYQFHQDHLKLCLSKKPISSETSLLYLCRDWSIVLLAAVTMLTGSVVAYLLQMLEYPRLDNHSLSIVGLACYLGLPSQCFPKSIPSRTYFGGFLTATTLFSMLFSGLLLDWTLKNHYFPQFDSFEQIIDAKYKLIGDSFAFAKLSATNNIKDRLVLNDKFVFCENAKDCLSQLKMQQDIVVAISNEYLRNTLKEFESDIYCISEDGFSSTYGVHFLLRKDFEFKSKLDRFIQMASDGGLISKWISDLNQKYIMHDEQVFRNKLSMEHMFSLSIICGVLILSATFVFLAEIFIYKQKSESNYRRFWSFAELFVDPDRHFLNYDLRYMLPISYPKEYLE